LLATGACQVHGEDAYYGHLVLRLLGCLVLFYLVFYQFRQLFYTASPLSEDSWDFFGSFSGRRL
jgi:hypothetical protein